jgi:hypothetical protein
MCALVLKQEFQILNNEWLTCFPSDTFPGLKTLAAIDGSVGAAQILGVPVISIGEESQMLTGEKRQGDLDVVT